MDWNRIFTSHNKEQYKKDRSSANTLKPFNGYITIDKGKVYFEYGMIGEMGNNSIYDIEEHVWVKSKGIIEENVMEDFLMDWERYKPDLVAKLQGLENIMSFEP